MAKPIDRAALNEQMNQLADGNRAAFEHVFAATWPLVQGFAQRLLGASHDAEDASQQAFMKVFSRAAAFKIGSEAIPWILGITSYECKTLLQKKRRRREDLSSTEELGALNLTSPSAEEQLSEGANLQAARDLLQDLSVQDRETILAALEEIERPEIPAATYRKRLERALERLRLKWRDKHE